MFNLKRPLLKWLDIFCAYSQIFKVIRESIQEGKMPMEVKRGGQIALLGIFCPLFWIALFAGAETSTIRVHAIHSGIVFLIGMGIMALGYFNEIKKVNDG